MQHSKMQCSLIDEGIFGLHHLPVAHTLVIVDTGRQVMPKAPANLPHPFCSHVFFCCFSLPSIATSEAPPSLACICGPVGPFLGQYQVREFSVCSLLVHSSLSLLDILEKLRTTVTQKSTLQNTSQCSRRVK